MGCNGPMTPVFRPCASSPKVPTMGKPSSAAARRARLSSINNAPWLSSARINAVRSPASMLLRNKMAGSPAGEVDGFSASLSTPACIALSSFSSSLYLGLRVASSQTVWVTRTSAKKRPGRYNKSSRASAMSGPLSAINKGADIFQLLFKLAWAIARNRDFSFAQLVDHFADR